MLAPSTCDPDDDRCKHERSNDQFDQVNEDVANPTDACSKLRRVMSDGNTKSNANEDLFCERQFHGYI